MKKKTISILIILLVAVFSLQAEQGAGLIGDSVKGFAQYEKGFIGLMHHSIKIGQDGTDFNYITQGGQDILFPFERFQAGIILSDTHTVRMLYQPLTIKTTVPFNSDVTIDGTLFEAGTAMDLTYGFPFWRVSYLYDFIKSDRLEAAVGGALQIRNASIIFEAMDGSAVTVSQNIGPVPAVILRGRYDFNSGFFASLDATGLYASSAIINGASFDFEGSILDASLRTGYKFAEHLDAFLNVRFLGGTAKGTSQYDNRTWSESVSQYTENYLSTYSVTVGATLR